jgi:hypothetical protein
MMNQSENMDIFNATLFSLFIIEQVALNKSSLLLNTQTLQLVTDINKTESIYKSY